MIIDFHWVVNVNGFAKARKNLLKFITYKGRIHLTWSPTGKAPAYRRQAWYLVQCPCGATFPVSRRDRPS